MESLTIFTKKDVLVVDSREVAKALELPHAELLKKLEGTKKSNGRVKQIGIIPTLNKGNFPVVDYFIKSTYIDNKGEQRPCYLFTRLGCDFIANKFTGEKGILFTAVYVKQFRQMEQLLLEKQTQQWIETRYHGKLTRKSETDTIKKLVEYAKEQGSEHADKLYIVYSNLANKIAGIHTRDIASTLQLNNLLTIENIILHMIEEGIKANKGYKANLSRLQRKACYFPKYCVFSRLIVVTIMKMEVFYMEKIEEIYFMLNEKRNTEEIRKDWDAFNKMEQETKINMEDNIFLPLTEYISDQERKGFVKGFKYAMQLMKECGL